MRPFQPEDLAQINRWYSAHGWAKIAPEQAQMRGVIVDDTAVGFLMQTDAGVAYLEAFVSNPNASPRNVARAIDQITAELMGVAASLGFKTIGALTTLPSMEKRARRLGLATSPNRFTLLTKALP